MVWLQLLKINVASLPDLLEKLALSENEKHLDIGQRASHLKLRKYEVGSHLHRSLSVGPKLLLLAQLI